MFLLIYLAIGMMLTISDFAIHRKATWTSSLLLTILWPLGLIALLAPKGYFEEGDEE